MLPMLSGSSGAGGASDSTKRIRLSRQFLEVSAEMEADDVFPVLKRAELYALFVQQWIEREAVKRGRVDANTGRADVEFVEQVVGFCKTMAAEMFMHDKTQYVRAQAPAQVTNAPASGLRAAKAKKAASQADSFLEELLASGEDEFQSSPVKRSGTMFSFLHKTVQEYFVALYVMHELVAKSFEKETFAATLETCDLSSLLIGKKLLTSGNVYETLRFCADLVDGRGQWYISGVQPPFQTDADCFDTLQPAGKAVWELAQASRQPAARKQHSLAVAAANA
ncbi:MAG: hypothetical protein ACK5QX_09510, partial [bacterium]